MDRKSKNELLMSAFRISRNLGEIYRSIDKEKEELRDSVSLAIYEIHHCVINPFMEDNPDIKKEIEQRMKYTGSAY